MAISDLTGTTWILNDNLSYFLNGPFAIDFTSNNNSYSYLYFAQSAQRLSYDSLLVYYNSWQVDNTYKTITITGGNEATDASLIAWLEANAVQQTPSETGIFFGTSNIQKMYFGNTEVKKVYYGNVLIYEDSDN